MSRSLRGASPLGLPYTLSHEPLRRLAPFAWAHSRARSPTPGPVTIRIAGESIRGELPLGLPYTLSQEPLRRLAPFAWAHSRARSPTPGPVTIRIAVDSGHHLSRCSCQSRVPGRVVKSSVPFGVNSTEGHTLWSLTSGSCGRRSSRRVTRPGRTNGRSGGWGG